ncbi:MAG: aminotransferase class I/II-fold pyridoxal phosphate-dependent enzyme [Desulfobacteraceae bacterium]|jgi:UDP-4-amino-4-deoxy-L-arabinose-oxoglutarate aminotransferase
MRKEFLPFSRPCISEEEISAVADVLRSGWITTGAKNAAFEQQFNQYVGSRHAVALTSATAGMHILLKALNIGPGDEVITPAMTWVSTVNLIVLAGATPVFADIDRDTLMVTTETVKPCLSSRTKMIIPVHFAGAPADLDSLRKLAADHGVFLVEDAAHAIGTAYNGERIGSTGTSIFSFHPIKNITTGEGGMFVTDDDHLAERIRRLKFHGLGVDAFDRTTQGRSPQAEVIEPGYKYNMPDMLAVLGMGQLKRLDEFIEKRHGLAMCYLEHFKSIDEIIPLSIPEDRIRHAWHLFIVRLDTDKTGITRDAFMEELKKRNIGTGLHFRAAHLQKYYRETFGFKPGMLPSTEWNSDRIFSLPLFPDMTADDVDDVVAAIKEVLCR